MSYSYCDGGPAVLLMPQLAPPSPCSLLRFVPLQHARPQPIQMLYRGPPPRRPVLMGGGVAKVRDVWAHNLDVEFYRIAALLPQYPCVTVDTEFPGTVHDSDTPWNLRGPRESYALVKKNVDDLKLLQVGIALSGPAGRCPYAWQFNLNGFDASTDPHAPDTVAMLRSQGMEFAELNHRGANPDAFAAGFHRFVLAGGSRPLTWAAFSGAYDFAYLVKVLDEGRPLPDTVESFRARVRDLFGPAVLDVQRLAMFCGGEDGAGIRGGLEKVAAALGVERVAGRAHCAGSDCLLTCDVLLAMLHRFFRYKNVLEHAGAIVGLV